MAQLFHFSPHQLEGSLSDIWFPELLEVCEARGITGIVSVSSEGWPGAIELRGGRIHKAAFQGLSGATAIGRMSKLTSGMFELTQQPGGGRLLGQRHADLFDVSLLALMSFSEENELSCRIVVSNEVEGPEVEIEYERGLMTMVAIGGEPLEDTLTDVAALVSTQLRVAGRPVCISIEGWSTLSLDPAVFECDCGVPISVSEEEDATDAFPSDHEVAAEFIRPVGELFTGSFRDEEDDEPSESVTVQGPRAGARSPGGAPWLPSLAQVMIVEPAGPAAERAHCGAVLVSVAVAITGLFMVAALII